MPVHDWTRVDAGIFHHFHQRWVAAICDRLNAGLLPPDYYALTEQRTGRPEPDVLTLRGLQGAPDGADPAGAVNGPGHNGGYAGLKLAPPKVRVTDATEEEFYSRKQRSVVIRHVSGDHVVAMVEVVSPGNKGSQRAFDQFIDKVSWFLEHNVHLLILDLLPPTPRDPRGVHAAVWDAVTGRAYEPPADKPLTLAAYERDPGIATRTYVEPVAVGDVLPEMPLYLIPGGYVLVPLEPTYQAAWESVPLRWRRVVAGEA